MKKICFSLVVLSMILLMVSNSFARLPREATSSEGKTTYTNIAVTGLDSDGTNGYEAAGLPSYIEMTSSAGKVYYLYIGYDGLLRRASDVSVGRGTSPSIVAWGDASGVIVGQSDYSKGE